MSKLGDTGITRLISGEKTSKGSLQVEAYGTIDELSSHVGLAIAFAPLHFTQTKRLRTIQQKLVIVGSMLATGSTKKEKAQTLTLEDLLELEGWLCELEQGLAPLKEFVLPGGNPLSAFLHVARTVCRRGERAIIRFMDEGNSVSPVLLSYMNRLSLFLFHLARSANEEEAAP